MPRDTTGFVKQNTTEGQVQQIGTTLNLDDNKLVKNKGEKGLIILLSNMLALSTITVTIIFRVHTSYLQYEMYQMRVRQ